MYYSVDDLQACAPEGLTATPGIIVELSEELDSMGFNTATIVGKTRDSVLDYVRFHWGDDEQTGGWISESVEPRIEAIEGELEQRDVDVLVVQHVEESSFAYVQLDETGGFKCPNPTCESDDLSTWADDGEADLADYWQCETCAHHGAIVGGFSDFSKTPNGVAIESTRGFSDYEIPESPRFAFAVYPGEVGAKPVVTSSREEAISIAHRTNGNWSTVPSTTTVAQLEQIEDADLVAVELAWYRLTKGDLNLTDEPNPADVALVRAMLRSGREFVQFDAQQFGEGGVEIDTVDRDELARRVAVCLSTLHYGIA